MYSNAPLELNESVINTLDSVLINLSASAFEGDVSHYELYFIRGTFYEKLLRLFGRKNMAFSKKEKHIYAAHPDFRKGILKRNNNEFEWLNLVQIISHEAVHSQMYKDHSRLGFMLTPSWINEGYCEYISYQPIRAQPEYQLSKVLNRFHQSNDQWLKTEYQSMTPRVYVRDRLLVEFLIDVKGKTIEAIIEDELLDPDAIYAELLIHFELAG